MNVKIERLIQAAEQGDAEAQYELAVKYYGDHGLPRDLTKAVYWFTKAAEQEHMLAQDDLAWSYKVGVGNLSIDMEKSQDWFAKSRGPLHAAAQQGDARAQHYLYKKYCLGLGVSTDYEEARKWLLRAVEQGYPKALVDYGGISEYGDIFLSVTKNMETAAHMYASAAAKGDASGQYALAKCYANGKGVPKDLNRAISLYTQAAEDDIGGAQYELGHIYANAVGVPKDLNAARHWISLAAEQGHDDAKKALVQLDGGATSISENNGCYVATCVYGSYDCLEVLTLRRYRDNKLSKSWLGRCFIWAYYTVSPKFVEVFGNKRWFYRICRPILDTIVSKLQKISSIKNI